VPSIQQTAALALGRLANYSDDLAEAVVANDILPQLVYSLGEQNVRRLRARARARFRRRRAPFPSPAPPTAPAPRRPALSVQRFYKKAAAFVLRAVAKHSPELAQAVVDAGSLEALVLCLEEFDPSVKEAAAWALGYIASHTASLAQAVVDAGTLPLLVLCLQEPEISLKRITASALNDIAKHSPELAQAVVDAGAVAYLSPLIAHDDAKLKRQVCSALAQVAKHSVDMAEVVVEAEVFPRMLACMKDVDLYVRKNAATCVREVVKHTPELAKLVVNSGGAAALVDFVRETAGNLRLPGIMALGYIAAFSETMALAVIVHKGVTVIKDALISEKEDHMKAACVWTLGQLGRHTPDHAKALTEAGVFAPLVVLLSRPDSSDDLRLKCKRALKSVIVKCTEAQALAPLVRDPNPKVNKYALAQFAAILPHDPAARKAFMATGLLQRVQELKASAPPKVVESIARINACYPDGASRSRAAPPPRARARASHSPPRPDPHSAEAVRFSDPGYARELLARLDEENA
jgi:3-methyladenine DNA glycosylase AlkD